MSCDASINGFVHSYASDWYVSVFFVLQDYGEAFNNTTTTCITRDDGAGTVDVMERITMLLTGEPRRLFLIEAAF